MNNHEKLKYLKLLIMLVAGLAMMICDYKTGRDLTVSLVHLLVVLAGFAIIGDIVVYIIQKTIEVPKQNADEREDLEQTDAQADEQEKMDSEQEVGTDQLS